MLDRATAYFVAGSFVLLLGFVLTAVELATDSKTRARLNAAGHALYMAVGAAYLFLAVCYLFG